MSEHRVSGCGCVCHRQKATTPTLPLHRDAVVNERILFNCLLPPPSSSGKGCTVPAGGESHPGLVTLRCGGGGRGGWTEPGDKTSRDGATDIHTHSQNTPPPPQREGEGEALAQAFLSSTHTQTHPPLHEGSRRGGDPSSNGVGGLA